MFYSLVLLPQPMIERIVSQVKKNGISQMSSLFVSMVAITGQLNKLVHTDFTHGL